MKFVPVLVPCSIPIYTDTRYHEPAENSPVNISICHGIRKPKSKTQDQFSMHFIGTDVYWNFNTEEDRDREYERIINMFSLNNPPTQARPSDISMEFDGGDYGR